MSDFTLGIIGCGIMGSAILDGIVKREILPAENIFINDVDQSKARVLEDKYGAISLAIGPLVDRVNHILIAVKPQDAGDLLQVLTGKTKDKTVISVMAGVKIDRMCSILGVELPVVRAMPNMAAFVGESITCVAFNEYVPEKEKEKLMKIFSGIGKVLEIDENQLDAVTALSGSGPAYLFYLADAMVAAGEEMGMGSDIVRQLVFQTLFGASALLRAEKRSPKDLIEAVASKGGTTEAALSVFEAKKVRDAVIQALLKAERRSSELSKG